MGTLAKNGLRERNSLLTYMESKQFSKFILSTIIPHLIEFIFVLLLFYIPGVLKYFFFRITNSTRNLRNMIIGKGLLSNFYQITTRKPQNVAVTIVSVPWRFPAYLICGSNLQVHIRCSVVRCGSEVFYKKVTLRNFEKFTGKDLYHQSFFLIKLQS